MTTSKSCSGSQRCIDCRFYFTCGGCSGECGAVNCYGQCSYCDYLCSRRPGAVAFLDSTLSGPGFPPPKHNVVTWPGKPPAILPAIANRFTQMPAPRALPWVALNSARMVISRGFDRGGLRRLVGTMRGFARIHQDTKIVCHMYIPDPPLEAFWRTRQDIYPALKEFNLVIAPNFSVYSDSPRMEHLINMKRSVLTYVEMLEQGIKAVPDVSWGTYTDLDHWAAYIRDKNIPVVSTSIQTVRQNAGNFWKKYLAGVKYLAQRISENTVIILVGAGSAAKMKAIQEELRQPVVFLTTQCFLLARKGRVIEKEKGKHLHAVGARDYDRLFLQNLENLKGMMQI